MVKTVEALCAKQDEAERGFECRFDSWICEPVYARNRKTAVWHVSRASACSLGVGPTRCGWRYQLDAVEHWRAPPSGVTETRCERCFRDWKDSMSGNASGETQPIVEWL